MSWYIIIETIIDVWSICFLAWVVRFAFSDATEEQAKKAIDRITAIMLPIGWITAVLCWACGGISKEPIW